MEISHAQLEKAENGQAVEIAENGTEFVLIRRDLFERLKRIIGYDDGELTPEEMARPAWEAGKSIGWDDPEMNAYNNYKKHRQ